MKKEMVEWEKEEQEKKEQMELDELREKSTPEKVKCFSFYLNYYI